VRWGCGVGWHGKSARQVGNCTTRHKVAPKVEYVVLGQTRATVETREVVGPALAGSMVGPLQFWAGWLDVLPASVLTT
jgi:hypothetical protein